MTTRTETERARKVGVVSRRRFTADEYHRMAQAEILPRDERVELIQGEIVEMSPIGARHARCVTELTRVLTALVGDDLRVSPQNPVRLSEHAEPQPDVAVIRAGQRYQADELSIPEDVLFVIEVSDTSLAYDREIKLPLYASFGIREVWIVDLSSNVIERHTETSREGYRLIRRAGRGESLASEVLPEIKIPVDDILS